MYPRGIIISSVQFSHSVMSDSLWPHGRQHARPPCPSPTPKVYSNSCPSSQWCCPNISSSVVPFSSHLQSFPASGSFQMSQLALGGQRIGVSASASVLPVNIQDWFNLGLTGLISLQSKGLSRVFSNTTVQKHQTFGIQPSLRSNSHICTRLLENLQFWLDRPLSIKWCLCFLMHCLGLSLAFFPKEQMLNSWLHSPFAVILEPKKMKAVSFHCFPIYSLCSDGTDQMPWS